MLEAGDKNETRKMMNIYICLTEVETNCISAFPLPIYFQENECFKIMFPSKLKEDHFPWK